MSGETFAVVRLGEVEALPTFGALKWKPLRRPLGVRAFGVNAYWAESAGDELIESHDELGDGAGRHEELYVVIDGAGRFTVADEEFDAPAGTVVFVRDPRVKRGAIATEPNTTVVAVGGAAGEPYRVSPWEWVAESIPAWRSGDYASAKETIAAGLQKHPDNAGLLYDLACVEALDGDAELAIEHLRRSVELKPEFAAAARRDDDFGSIRADPRFPA